MLSRNRSLLSAMAVMACLELLVAWDAEAQGYFYAIGHMTNTRSAVDWTISTGANALEADLNFDDAGNPTVFRHGFPCDCTCFTGACAITSIPVTRRWMPRRCYSTLQRSRSLCW